MSPQKVSSPAWGESHETLFVYCPTCARESLAEAPPCPDGHADCCPELACLECGTALLDAAIVELVQRSDATRRGAARPRHAA